MNKSGHPVRVSKRPTELKVGENEVWVQQRFGNVDYEISSYGRVRRYLRPFTTKRMKYPQVYVSGKGKVYIHHLVAELWIGKRPKKHHIDHIDSDPANAHFSNLEYVTPGENIRRWHKRKRVAMASAERLPE